MAYMGKESKNDWIYVSEMKVTQLCLTLCDPVESSLPGSFVHGILQARILEWVAIPFSKGSSWPRDWTHVSCLAGRFFTTEPPRKEQRCCYNILQRTGQLPKTNNSLTSLKCESYQHVKMSIVPSLRNCDKLFKTNAWCWDIILLQQIK